MANLTLWYSSDCVGTGRITLERCEFTHPLLAREQRIVRGKTCGAYQGWGTFQWTPAVKALSILMLRSASVPTGGNVPLLLGEESSPAASLDYAISKSPNWLLDMFGVDGLGTPISKRIFRRSNPERKRPGPVVLSLNERQLAARDLRVFVDGGAVEQQSKLVDLANAIEADWPTRTGEDMLLRKIAVNA